MVTLSSKEARESQASPGVRYAIRTLNEISRARRDLKLIEARARLSALASELERMPDPDGELARIRATAADRGCELSDDERDRIDEVESDPATGTIRVKRLRLRHEIDLLVSLELKPAYIRAGLVAIEGLEIDGKPATVETVLESGGDELIEEIYRACYAASDLSPEQRKNWSSLPISVGPADGSENNTIAPGASA